ncbi:MAG: hypothetical protein LBN00_02685, partial [Oscillospiraceae bacterium]|nr:hypothetical protein [Oscillospiraceae bacterium]
LITEVIVSAVFVLFEQIGTFSLPIVWFILIQVVILAIFAIRTLTLKAGQEIIENRGAVVAEKVFVWKSLIVDVETIMQSTPEFSKDIKPVVDAIKYSDPMSNPQLAEYEDAIKDSIIRLNQAAIEKEADRVSELCVTLQRQIKDRNNRVKLLK